MPAAAVVVVRQDRASERRPAGEAPPLAGVSVNTNGTRNAGSVYFQVSIIVRNGLPPVSAAAANGDSAVGGLTSESTA